MKLNCWEYRKCGRGPDGKKAKELGVCPAATNIKADGIHNGKNGGRSCWGIARTLGKGKVHGTFAEKLLDCLSCNFYKLVMYEEERHFLTAVEINSRIQ